MCDKQSFRKADRIECPEGVKWECKLKYRCTKDCIKCPDNGSCDVCCNQLECTGCEV
jgi:hypothetical protein